MSTFETFRFLTAIYFTEKPHKLLFSSKGAEVTLTKNNMTAPTCAAYHCPTCRKVILDYGV